jgi:hypothetical protein
MNEKRLQLLRDMGQGEFLSSPKFENVRPTIRSNCSRLLDREDL